ncbi:MAG: histone deacetylase [Microthrixaceae bacterium]|nr:histone deacetylase [Microthrixaceae bacterium]
MGVLVVTSDRFALHDTGRWHPERAARLTATAAALGDPEFEGALRVVEPREATDAELRSVHTAEHIGRIRVVCSSGGGALDADTPVVAASLPAALAGAGSGLRAIEELEADRDAAPPGGDGDLDAAFCVVRPPGHHATASTAMGFCLFNNVAVSAAALAARGERVLIADFDAHHGNGTQDIFYERDDVMVVSWHEWPQYPGTGRLDEMGRGAGLGSTVNIPLPTGATAEHYLASLTGPVGAAIEAFGPTWVLISAGYDGHRRDPLCGLGLTDADFGAITRELLGWSTPGRRLLFLEGGYDLDALRDSLRSTLSTLTDAGLHPVEGFSSGGPGAEVLTRLAELRSRADLPA